MQYIIVKCLRAYLHKLNGCTSKLDPKTLLLVECKHTFHNTLI